MKDSKIDKTRTLDGYEFLIRKCFCDSSHTNKALGNLQNEETNSMRKKL